MDPITIVGTGAMALFFSSRLAAAGYQIQLLGTWLEGLSAVQKDGIWVEAEGKTFNYPALAGDQQALEYPVRLTLVLVKSWQTERVAGQLKHLLEKDGIALTLQNGLGNIQLLLNAVGEERAAQGVTTYGATLLGPGKVKPGGDGVITVQEHPRLAPLIRALRDSGLSVQVTDNLSSLVWGKLIINVAINPLTALLEVKNGQLLESQTAVKVMGLAAREAAAVAERSGITINYSDPAQAAESVAKATANNISSMLQDIRRGAPTEIDALCGEIVIQGNQVGQATPVNQLLDLLIKAKVDSTRI